MWVLNASNRPLDRGVSLIIVAASLLFMFGLAAVVVDAGLGWSERRQAQSAADFAVLATFQETTSCDGTGCDLAEAAENGAEEAIRVADLNLPGRFAPADWLACTDPNRPPRFDPSNGGHVAASVTQCASFTANFDEARVVLPDDEVDTLFARVIGFDTLTTGAFAEAGQGIDISAEIIPLSPTAQTGSEACLLSNQAPQTVDPCLGAASSFSGFLDVALFGKQEEDDPVGTPSTCALGNTNLRIAINLAKGSDHIMTTFDGGDPINDHEACPNRSEDVDELEVRETAGAVSTSLTPGLIDGVSGSINGQAFSAAPGRISCQSESVACENIRGESLDHTGLWEFLAPGVCPGVDTHAEMATCLEDWGGGVIFEDTLGSHPRFTAVPVFTTSVTGPGAYLIADFKAVWLETIYTNCNASRCLTVHSPGEAEQSEDCPDPIVVGTTNCGWDESGNYSVEGLTAFVLHLDMLPSSISDFFPGVGNRRTTALTR